MITRIELQNFMSHKRSVIEPAAGLTVLVGPNNVGKSAVFAALQILAHNEKSTFVLRHGEKECAVIVHTDDGHVIEWRRKTAPHYLIDGQRHDRLGNAGVPQELQPALRLPMVAEENDESFDVHFGSQKSPVFLLGSKPSVAARFFASSSDAIRLLQMQQRHKEKVTEAKRELKQLELEASRLSAEVTALSSVAETSTSLEILQAEYNDLLKLGEAIEQLDQLQAALINRADQLHHAGQISKVLGTLNAPPELEDEQSLEELTADLEECRSRKACDEACMDVLSRLQSPPVVEDESTLQRLIDQLEQVQNRLQINEEVRGVLAGLNGPPELEDVQPLEKLQARLVQSVAAVQSLGEINSTLVGLTVPPEVQDDRELAAIVDRLSSGMTQLERLTSLQTVLTSLPEVPVLEDALPGETLAMQLANTERRIAQAVQEQQEIEAEIQQVITELKQLADGAHCQTCGQPLSAEVLLSMSGAHQHD